MKKKEVSAVKNLYILTVYSIFYKTLIINAFKKRKSLTANFGEFDRNFLMEIFKISPRKLRSNFLL